MGCNGLQLDAIGCIGLLLQGAAGGCKGVMGVYVTAGGGEPWHAAIARGCRGVQRGKGGCKCAGWALEAGRPTRLAGWLPVPCPALPCQPRSCAAPPTPCLPLAARHTAASQPDLGGCQEPGWMGHIMIGWLTWQACILAAVHIWLTFKTAQARDR